MIIQVKLSFYHTAITFCSVEWNGAAKLQNPVSEGKVQSMHNGITVLMSSLCAGFRKQHNFATGADTL